MNCISGRIKFFFESFCNGILGNDSIRKKEAILLENMFAFFLLPLILIDNPIFSIMTPTKARSEEITDAINAFAFKLLTSIPTHFKGNSVVSPFSIFQILGMLYMGLRGKSREDLLELLGLSEGITGQEYAWLNVQEDNQGADWEVANSIWPRLNYDIEPAFVQQCTEFFQATVEALDYANDPSGSKARINSWVKDETKGMIPSLVDKINSATALVLCNAVYFFAKWREGPFDSDHNVDQPFFLEDGSSQEITYMTKDMDVMMAEDVRTEWVLLNYRGGYYCIIALPKKQIGLNEWLEQANLAQMEAIFPRFKREYASLYLPKFHCDGDWDLLEWLNQHGLDLGRTADFSGIVSSESIFVSESRHKCRMEVNEEGTKASAASSMVFARGGFFGETKEVKINRPFCLFILNGKKGTINFTGLIRELKGEK